MKNFRSKIVRSSFVGTLTIEGRKYENVKCELEKDYFSNKNISVEFDLYSDYNSLTEFDKRLNYNNGGDDFDTFEYYAYNGKGNLTLEGHITGSNFSLNQFPVHQELYGKVEKYTNREIYSNISPNRVEIYFKMPYSSVLNRRINRTWNDENTALLFKFYKKPFKVFINDINVEFLESFKDFSHTELTFMLEKIVEAKISFNLTDESDITKLLEDLTELIRELCLIISFLQRKRINVHGYDCYEYNKDKLIKKIEHIDTRYDCGQDYLIDNVGRKFGKLFNPFYVSEIFKKFRESPNKSQIIAVINKMLCITDDSVFESYITESAILLEAAARIVVGQKEKGYQHVVEMALDKLGIRNEVKFSREYENSVQWMITKQRNNFVHFKNEDFMENVLALWKDYQEIIRIVRLMILKILDKDFVEIPLPE